MKINMRIICSNNVSKDILMNFNTGLVTTDETCVFGNEENTNYAQTVQGLVVATNELSLCTS